MFHNYRFVSRLLSSVVTLLCLSNESLLHFVSFRLWDKHQQWWTVWGDQHCLQPFRWSNLPVWRLWVLCCTAARNDRKIQCE